MMNSEPNKSKPPKPPENVDDRTTQELLDLFNNDLSSNQEQLDSSAITSNSDLLNLDNELTGLFNSFSQTSLEDNSLPLDLSLESGTDILSRAEEQNSLNPDEDLASLLGLTGQATDGNFDELEDLLGSSDAPEAKITPEEKREFLWLYDRLDELDKLIEAPNIGKTSPQDFILTLQELEGLLDDGLISAAATPPPVKQESFEDLEDLLDKVDSVETDVEEGFIPAPETTPVVEATTPAITGPQSRNKKGFDETMRVGVKQLDNLSNLIGELVVRRNRLEEGQSRMRQSIEKLLGQGQSLNDVGNKMRDLYEKSLLEGALNASRERSQSSGFGYGKAKNSANEGGLDALELDSFSQFHPLSQEIIELIVRIRESVSDIQFIVDEGANVTQGLRQVTSQLQDGINASRMVAFAETADRLPRAVRDISRKLNKEAELQIQGKDVLIDKLIVEHLYNPMTHLVNNAVAHGIESPEERAKVGKPPQGQIKIDAYFQGNQTVIVVADDGGGINPERVKVKALEKGLITRDQARQMAKQDVYDLLFRPGFSTKDQADDFAGRGVGLDVVATDLRKIRGKISIDSKIGQGTTFTIRLPLTLSICKALFCLNHNSRIAFPMDGVEGMKEYSPQDIQTNEEGQPCVLWDGELLPFQGLDNLLLFNRQINRSNIYSSNRDDDSFSIVLLRSVGNFIAVRVDKIIGEQEIVIKQIEGPVPKPAGIAGATVLGDGSIMPIADVLELIEIAQGRRSINLTNNTWTKAAAQQQQVANRSKKEPLVLVVDDSITVRELLSLSFNKLGYRVEQARDGQEAWDKLRNGLPCDIIFCDIEMPRMNGLELLSNLQKDEPLSQIPVAMLTSRGAERHRKLAADLGAAAYLTKPYTEKDLMDVAQRMLTGEILLPGSKRVVKPKTAVAPTEVKAKLPIKSDPSVMIIDDSLTVRELLSMTYKKAGFLVEQARDGQEAWDKLNGGTAVDLIICDIEMPRMNGLELLSHLKANDILSRIPVAMLTSRGAEKHRRMAADRGAKGYLTKPYIEEVLLDVSKRLMAGEVLLEQ